MFGRRRRSPKQLLSQLSAKERELLAIESKNREIAAKAREAAKSSLRLGDRHGYQKAAVRHAIAIREARVSGGMIEIVEGLLGCIQNQRGLERVVAIGRHLGQAQRELDLDPDRLNRIMDHLDGGIDTVNQAAVSIASTLKAISWGETTPKELEQINEELLKELEQEATANRRVKQELHEGKKAEPDRQHH